MSDSPINLDAAQRADAIADPTTVNRADAALAAIVQICGGDLNSIANVLSINVARILSGAITGGTKHVNEILWINDMKRRKEGMENPRGGSAIVIASSLPPAGAARAILGKKNGRS